MNLFSVHFESLLSMPWTPWLPVEWAARLPHPFIAPLQPQAPVRVGHDPLEGIRFFFSGISNRTDLGPFVAAWQPVGFSQSELGPTLEQAALDYLKGGGHVFIDNGAVRAFVGGDATDFRESMCLFRRMARRAGRCRLSVVMPDVLGDQAGTLELQSRYAAEIRTLIDRGLDVLLPLQLGPMPLGSVVEALREMLGSTSFRLAIPSGRFPFSLADLETLLPAAVGLRGVHFLGIGNRLDALRARARLVRQWLPDAMVSADAAWLRRHTGDREPITELRHEFLHDLNVPGASARQLAITSALSVRNGLGLGPAARLPELRPRRRRGIAGVNRALPLAVRQSMGAMVGNGLRACESDARIINAQRALMSAGRLPTRAAVGRLVGLTREQVSRRYGGHWPPGGARAMLAAFKTDNG